jgi:hypothetical protein
MLSSLDELQIEKIFKDTYGLLLKEKMRFVDGKIIVYKNQIAYKFEFKSVAGFLVLLDERGKFSGFTQPRNLEYLNAENTESSNTVIDSGIIKTRKAEFLDSLSASIGTRAINELFRKRYKLEIVDKIIYKEGEIVVFNDHVTYQFLYEADVIFSILIDRKGNYINFSKENYSTTLGSEYTEKTDSQ